MPFPDYVSDSSSLQLTSIAEIQRVLSYAGQSLFTDDLNPDDPNYNPDNSSEANLTNYLTELVQRATSHVMQRLAPRYDIANVYRIPRLREIATYYACYKLSRRRGNEPIYEEEYAEALDELDMMRRGEIYLDAPSNGQRAYMQSYVIDNRFSRTPVRVIPEASTSTISGQNRTYNYGFAWL